jgi:hypothetical protein
MIFNGKTTRPKPSTVVADCIAIPKELMMARDNIKLCMDSIKITNTPFVTTISCNTMNSTVKWIPDQTPRAKRSVHHHVFHIHNCAGSMIKTIHCDPTICNL